jgi:hypothetical protein
MTCLGTDPFVRVELSGGLGNQIFGYVAGLYAQEISKRRLQLDFSKVSYSHVKSPYDLRSFNLEECKILDHKFSDTDAYKLLMRVNDSLSYRSNLYKNISQVKHDIIVDLNPAWKNLVMHELSNLKKNTILKGPFANAAYIDKLEDFRSEHLSLTLKEKSSWFLETISEMQSVDPICIHVRRGDYMELEKTKSRVGLLSLDYYERSLKLIRAISGENNPVWIFSDSPNVVAKLFQKSAEFRRSRLKVIQTALDHDPAEILVLFGSSNFRVISNSSFSFWASRLNLNSKLTVYPNRYYWNDERNLEFIYPKWVSASSSWE